VEPLDFGPSALPFRANEEIQARFFDSAGALKANAVERLHSDVSELLLPSAAHALEADKAYRVLVTTQDFARGRSAHVLPVNAVHRQVQQEQTTGP
jgi:hypothetical protein